MKATAQNIYNVLQQKSLLDNYSQLQNKQPDFTYQEMTLNEAFEEFKKIQELVIATIDSGVFETLQFNKKNQFLIAINTINQQLAQAQQHSFNLTPSTNQYANTIIQNTASLIDLAEVSNLYAKSMGTEAYAHQILSKEVSKLYKTLLSEEKNANKCIEKIKDIANTAKNTQEQLTASSRAKNEIDDIVSEIKNHQKDIEVKKLGIDTFYSNVEEHKSKIEKLTKQAEEILTKEATINNLIASAEKALNLKSAEGISAAFTSQYNTARDTNIININFWLIWASLIFLIAIVATVWLFYFMDKNFITTELIFARIIVVVIFVIISILCVQQDNKHKHIIKRTISLWIVGASICLLIAFGVTIWIATTNINSASLIIARIVAVAISLAGATFCAKQYIKQRNITEDYAYKAVLSKSIVAFTEEIKKRDEERVAEYLTKVLDEIHKDPLRTRETKNDANFGLNINDLINKLINKFPDSK
jgi:hypothetical protein